ncbi:MAG TPA: DUF177 domain-containing protein [Candidatus Merdivicinus intestinavium]|nr:DUF177 domain-containing protein [Candidatus Merdivicinus intestinavium]
MKMNLKQLFDLAGEKKSFSENFDYSREELYGRYPFQSPVACSGEIENRAGVVRLVFCVKFSLNLVCDRCLEPFEREEAMTFSHTLVQQLESDADEEEYVLCPGGELDLDELVRTDVLLALPTKVLCSEDCKGLCEQCGQNLNFGSCKCEKKQIDPRLSVLSQLLESMEEDPESSEICEGGANHGSTEE